MGERTASSRYSRRRPGGRHVAERSPYRGGGSFEDDAVADDLDAPAPPPDDDLARSVDALLCELVEHQERRLVALGQRLYPGLSRDDLHNFDDIPALAGDPLFVYEDGHYAGLLAARAALRSLLRRREGFGAA